MKTRKILTMMLILAIAISSVFYYPLQVKAEEAVTVYVGGNELSTKGVIIDGRTLVPLRDLAEALEATVDWNEATRMITLSKTIYEVSRTTGIGNVHIRNVYLWIDKPEASINGDFVELDVAPQMVGANTMLPARAVCEWFDATVEWNGDTNTVTVTTGANSSFADARINNAEIELAEKEAINNVISGLQDEADMIIEEMDKWISEYDLNSKGVTFQYWFPPSIAYKEVGFYSYGGLTGSIGSLLYAVPDFDDILSDNESSVYNGVTIRRYNGVLYFLTAELQNLGILK